MSHDKTYDSGQGSGMTQASCQSSDTAPVEIAAFDFDGTCIPGNSPVSLVFALMRQCRIRPSVIIRMGLWALAYKLRLPQNEKWVRELVFRAFQGRPQEEVDAYLRNFYNECIVDRFRPEIDALMQEHRQAGRIVMIVSASFDPIIRCVLDNHPVDYQISTCMAVDEQGNYMNKVLGTPVEGEEKPRAIAQFADEQFGSGNWRLAYAYGDHHSDRPMLHAADHPVAVSPDKPLTRTAKHFNWEILDIND